MDEKDIGVCDFSERNLKNMRRFYEHFSATSFGQFLTAQTKSPPFGQRASAKLSRTKKSQTVSGISLSKDANIHAWQYQLYLPGKDQLKQKSNEWTIEAGETCK